MKEKMNRRDFIRVTTVAGLGVWVSGRQAAFGATKSPNEKLNVASIGCGGMGWADLTQFADAGENIVALCDVDDERAAEAYKRFPNARRYKDFRKLLEEGKDIDAVHISTPDHVHAVAAVMAMRLGKHVYCQKPLTRTVYEARVLLETAERTKVVTQMGNQQHGSNELRQKVEIIQSGAIGPVREVHVWTDRPIWPQGLTRPTDTPAVPATLDWNLWLGPAPERPYHPCYVPFSWRGWWDFGSGALGDMGCHIMDMPYWGLKLEYPVSFEAESEGFNGETFPNWSTVTYEFPARGDLPPVKLVWYDGKKDGKPNLPPAELFQGQPAPSNGSLLIGEKGTLLDIYGAPYKLLPEKDFEGYEPPAPTIARGPGHYQEFIQACKGGPAPLSQFSYSAKLTETVILGCLAIRAGQKVKWFAPNMKPYSLKEAEAWVREPMRPGYSL